MGYLFFSFLFNLYQMQKNTFKSKETIDKAAREAVENPETLTNVLSSSSVETFFKEWFKVINEPVSHCRLSIEVLNDFVQQKVNTIKYAMMAYFIIALLIFMYLQDDPASLSLAFPLFYFITPFFLLFQLHDYKTIQVKTINAYSLILKEASLIVAIRFDYFYKNEKIIEHYKTICKDQTVKIHDDCRVYLSMDLQYIAMLGVHENNYNPVVRLKILWNIADFHKLLLNQVDTRVFLNENYNSMFKHRHKKFI